MAYGKKYTAEFRNTRGLDYRLEVYQRDFSGTSKKIGALAGCALEIQGNMGDIIAPVIKTNLRFTVIDVTGKSNTSSTRWNDWTEFYTPDATLYKVVLSELNGSTATAIWSGYVTPDSWLEQLTYRGAITITARDNIGHLKDFPFVADGYITPDANGLIEIRWLLARAMQIVDFAMDFWVEQEGHGAYSPEVPESDNGDYLTEACVNASLFEGMDWYEAFERTLEAIGFAFRYVGQNKCVAGPLRNLNKIGHYTSAVQSQTMEFYGGTLELDPAVKKIEEEQDYKMQKEIGLPVFDGLEFAGSYSTYRCKTDGNPLPGGGTVSVPEHDAQYKPNTSSGRTGWDIGSGMLNPESETPDDYLKREEGEDGWKKYAFLAVNQQPVGGVINPVADYRFKTRTAGMKLTFRFTPNALTKRNSGSMSGKMAKPKYTLANVKYYAMYTDGTNTYYWNGAGWVSTAYLVSVDFDSENQETTDLVIEMSECQDITGVGEMVIRIGQMTYKMSYEGGYGCYARVANIGVEINAQAALESNKVTTINNNDYNVMLTRRPLFGALSREMGFVKPANYKAGIFLYPYVGADPELFPYLCRFTDGEGGTVPLPVLIHMQILCYYHGAARVLSGNCAPVNKGRFSFEKLCVYKGHTYLLQGGTMDFFSGIMSGAVLREFVDFSTLWSGGAPSYSDDVIYNG